MVKNHSCGIIIHKTSNEEICAVSAETNATLFSGTDAADVINAAIQSIPLNQGGEVRIRAGEYLLTKSILIDRHGITLSGDGRKSGCYGGPPYLRSDLDIEMLLIRKDGERLRGVTIKDISFFGSGTSNGKAGIHSMGCSDFLVLQNVGVYNTETGVWLQGGPAGAVDAAQLQFIDPQQCGRGLLLEYCHYTKVFGGDFSDNSCNSIPPHLQSGIHLTGNQFGSTTGTKIVGSTAVRNRGCGIMVGTGCSDIAIQAGCDLGGNGCHGLLVSNEAPTDAPDQIHNININGLIAYNNAQSGINVENGNHVLITGCITSVNEHPHIPDLGQQYGILIGESAKNVMVHGNMAYGNSKEQISDGTNVPDPAVPQP